MPNETQMKVIARAVAPLQREGEDPQIIEHREGLPDGWALVIINPTSRPRAFRISPEGELHQGLPQVVR